MATLVLGAVGNALGGPVGGALGSLVGQSIDQQILGGGPSRGPRLGDLSVQTSAYGTPVPRIYGSMRVAGSVIWSTDLVESEQAVSGGKSGGDQLRYSYSASFAVALSSRTAVRIGRIWADGQLLRGAAGDLKVKGTLRFHRGDEDQAVDPLIASVEGVERTPAFRGLAVAVFEELSLAGFGNRIPMLTFELIADERPVPIGAILADASEGVIESGCDTGLVGYSVHGIDRRSALSPLIEMSGLRLGDVEGRLRDGGDVLRRPLARELGCSAEAQAAPVVERRRAAGASIPDGVAIGYYEPARDYQSGLATAGAQGGALKIDFAAAIDAPAARAMADARLSIERAAGDRATLHLGPGAIELLPGNRVRCAPLPGEWVVETVDVNGLATSIGLTRATSRSSALPGDSGRAANAADLPATPTVLAWFDLPDEGGPSLMLAGATSGRWSPVAVQIAANDVAQGGVTLMRPAVLGTARTVLAPGSTSQIDLRSFVEVQLVSTDGWLTGCDQDALAMGQNLAALGDELFQFGRVDPVGNGVFRLSRLLRGQRGTEWAMAAHRAGEPFVLVDPSRLARVPVAREMLGARFAATPGGVADASTAASERVAQARGACPPAPCHLQARRLGSGVVLSWVRRSRSGWAWIDETDVPLGEAAEAYRVRVVGPGGQIERSTNAPELTLEAADLTALGSGTLSAEVVQIGDWGASPAARTEFSF